MNTKCNFIATVFGSIVLASAAFSTASANGLITDVLRGAGVINKEQGDLLDSLNEQFKKDNPEYGGWEEDMTNRNRKNLGLRPHCDPIFDKRGRQIGCQNN